MVIDFSFEAGNILVKLQTSNPKSETRNSKPLYLRSDADRKYF
jgi:hypothetical protein